MKGNRTKKTDIPQAVRIKVYDRDNGACIFCGRPGFPNAHVINRSQGGLGIEQNIITACADCHNAMDNGKGTGWMREYAVRYLQKQYPEWKKEDCVYDKWKGVF